MRIRQDKQTAARIREVAQSAAERIGSTVGPVAEAQSAELRARLAPAVEQASAVARDRVERGLRAAAPRVESASHAMAPHVEKARDRLVDDIVPRLAEAVVAAATAGAAAMHSAGDSAGDRLQAVADKAEAAAPGKKSKGRRAGRFLLLAVVAAAIGAGLASWKRRVKDSDDFWQDIPTAVPSTTPSAANHTPASNGASGSFGDTAADAPAVGEGLETPSVEETPTPIDHEELTLDGAEETPAESAPQPAAEPVTGPAAESADEPVTQTITTKAARARKAKPEASAAPVTTETAADEKPADPA